MSTNTYTGYQGNVNLTPPGLRSLIAAPTVAAPVKATPSGGSMNVLGGKLGNALTGTERNQLSPFNRLPGTNTP